MNLLLLLLHNSKKKLCLDALDAELLMLSISLVHSQLQLQTVRSSCSEGDETKMKVGVLSLLLEAVSEAGVSPQIHFYMFFLTPHH